MATRWFMNTRALLALIIVLCIANQYSSLKISAPASWRSLTSITADSGTTYHLYKPRCPGLYRFGDVFASSSSTNPPAGLLSCVQPGSETAEADWYNFEDSTLGGASIFDLYSDNLSLSTLGHASMETNIFNETFERIPNNQILSNSTLTKYAVLTSDPCDVAALVDCDTSSIFTVTVNVTYIGGYYNETDGNTTIELPIEMTNYTVHRYIYWNPLQKMLTFGSDHMLLMRYAGTEDSPIDFTPYCFTNACVCPTCVNGACEGRGGCICDPFWEGENCNQDVDECASNATNNCAAIATCENKSPGFTCKCPLGYTSISGGQICQDIDECSIPALSANCTSRNLNCTNIPGSFVCTNCIVGYIDVGNNGTCFSAAEIYRCGNNVLDLSNNEECDGGNGCKTNCKCDVGFSPQGTVACSRNCGNGVLDVGEECDGGIGCINSTCVCNANLGYLAGFNMTDCKRELLQEDVCLLYNGNCTTCAEYSCLYCPLTGTCATSRIYMDCVAECPGDEVIIPVAPVAFEPESNTPSGNGTGIGGPNPNGVIEGGANAAVIVPAVVVPVTVVVAGVILLVFLLRRKNKKRRLSDQEIRLSASSRTSANSSRSKYGIDRTEIMTTPTKNWQPPPQSEFVLINKLPFDVSKRVDFNVGGNQYKVGQRYTEVIVVSAKDKKSSTLGGAIQFEFHPPSSPKATLEFNPPSGVIKKGKPVEVEVSLTVNMTCTIDLEYGIECPSERMHTFASVNVVSELSSFIDIEEVQLSGGASAKPVGDGAFGVVYKGKYRGQDVAVKMLKVQDMPEEMLDEFDREVDLMNKLRHKNIVQFVGASKVVGKFALITEFIERGNLADRVFKQSNKPLDYGFKIKAALDTARAMLFLHENRVLHRDLKLDNLLVVSVLPDDPVCVKLTDFGSSRAVSEKIQNSYTSGIGTPIYMAPEILTKKPYDTKSDVYSFGVMLWILYTQKQPYTNFDHSWDVAQFVIEGNREKIPKDCPPDFRTLIELCWSQDPSERPTFNYIAEHLEKMFETNRATMPVQSNSKRKSTFLV